MSETDMQIEDGNIIEEGNTIEEESIWKNWRIIAALFVIHFFEVKDLLTRKKQTSLRIFSFSFTSDNFYPNFACPNHSVNIN